MSEFKASENRKTCGKTITKLNKFSQRQIIYSETIAHTIHDTENNTHRSSCAHRYVAQD